MVAGVAVVAVLGTMGFLSDGFPFGPSPQAGDLNVDDVVIRSAQDFVPATDTGPAGDGGRSLFDELRSLRESAATSLPGGSGRPGGDGTGDGGGSGGPGSGNGGSGSGGGAAEGGGGSGGSLPLPDLPDEVELPDLPDVPGVPLPDVPGVPLPDLPEVPLPDLPDVPLPDLPDEVPLPDLPDVELPLPDLPLP